MDFKKILTGGNPAQAGYVAVAGAVSGALGALIGTGLDKVSGGRLSAALGSSNAAIANLAAAGPAVLGAIALEAVGQKMKSSKAEKLGQALMLVAIVDLSESLLGGPISSMLASATGGSMQGVAFTPMGKRRGLGRRRGMRGVDFTMGAVPRGLGAVPRGIGSYLPSPGGTLSTAADFGAVPHGMRGLTSRDHADFGAARQAADFGGVDFTMGAIPSLRGSHTGDMQYPDPSLDADGNEDDTNESGDHTV